METSQRKSARKTSSKERKSFELLYIEYLLNHGKRPASVFKFCNELGAAEADFYAQYGSFEGLEKQIWKTFLTTTVERLKKDAAYTEFSAREKILAFYYSFFEALKSQRSFVLVQLENVPGFELVPSFLKDFRVEFRAFIETVLGEAKASGEIANRPVLDKRYPEIFWLHMGFLLNFWRKDDSAGFEQTDAAIEKSVNLAFDLIGKGAVDSVIDFAKFIYQTKI